MAFEKARSCLEGFGLADRIIVTEHSSATVEEAAATAAEAAKAEVEEALKKAQDFDNMNLETLQEIVEKLKAPLEKLGYTLQLEKKAAE